MPLRLAVAALAVAAAAARAAEPWEGGEPRLFLAGRLEAGLHERALAQVGFGRPHWAWAGVQAGALLTSHAEAAEAGIRAVVPGVDLEVMLRRTRAFDRPLLAASASHVEDELSGGHARFTVVDAGLSGVVPTPGGLVAWELEWVRPLDLPAGAHAFEETWHVAIAGRGAAAVRVGWLAGPLRDRLRIGPFVETVRLFGRSDGTVWRAGGALGLRLGRHLSLLALGLAPAGGPDRFRAWTASYGTVALRYAFATGDPAPGFP